ncbi:c-type cytochrome [Flavisphingopyxis soli]|nr:c-type cytochrome [Sphingorhabdus soli]
MESEERERVEGGEERARPLMGRGVRTAIIAIGGGAALFVIASLAFDAGIFSDRGEVPMSPDVAQAQMFQPPAETSIPDGPAGDAVRRGQAIFVNTASNAGDFVGNGVACASCHLDSGRRANSAPMWAAWVAYPKYRSKNKQINTMEDRIKGCFTYSMNAQASKSGGPPPAGHAVYKDLETYMHWLATGAPTGANMPGAGYPTLEKTSLGYEPARGQKVFVAKCAACHGADGAGQLDINGRIVFPPLWGPNSFNWGAGMARVNTAAGFIKANMPLGQGSSLTDQQAWDVAAYIDSQERPKDPRQTGSIEENAKANHGGDSYYGKRIDGRLVGVGTP